MRTASCSSVSFSRGIADAGSASTWENQICPKACVDVWLAGAPAMMPSKSSGYRWAAVSACRPPVEQPLKYESFAGFPKNP